MVDTIVTRDGNGNSVTVATNDAVIAQLVAILSKLSADPATQTTLAAVLAKLSADPATAAKQDALAAKDFATETTLDAVLAKITNDAATATKQDLLAALTQLIGTRAYGATQRITATAVSNASTPIVATEVMVFATARVFVKAGAGTPVATITDSIPVAADLPFTMRITSGHAVAVIADEDDCLVYITPIVAG